MMDRLYRNIGRVKALVAQNTLSLFGQELDVLFFDVTTLYFESFTPDELRKSCVNPLNMDKDDERLRSVVETDFHLKGKICSLSLSIKK